jgi:nucleotide sugar dehydrogenase
MNSQIYKIGFIGQGYIGKNYADDFEKRGYAITRYALEPQFEHNKEAIKECDIVFIAVPTPTTPNGFDSSIVAEAVGLLGKGKIAVIKSTILPGTTRAIQTKHPDVIVLHSPEFLTEATAAADAANPDRNIIGMPEETEKYKEAAKRVMSVLPKAKFEKICRAEEAELVKYGGNCFFYSKVIFMNLMYDLAQSIGADWQTVKESMVADPRIGPVHMDPVHKTGRGAGGHCFIKDFAAFKQFFIENVDDAKGRAILESLEAKNFELLLSTAKDLDLLQGVYGPIQTESNTRLFSTKR